MRCLLLLSLFLVPRLAVALEPPRPPLRTLVPESTVHITPGTPARYDATLTLVVLEDGPVMVSLVDPQVAVQAVTVDGKPAGVLHTGNTLSLLGRWAAGTHQVRVSGLIQPTGDATTGSVAVRLPTSAHSRVTVAPSDGQAVQVDGAVVTTEGHVRHTPEADTPVRIQWRPEGPTPPRPRTLFVDQQTVLAVDEAETVGRARIDLRVEHGAVDQLPLRIPGGAEAVEVLSPPGATARVSGEQVVVQFSNPITDIARIDLRYRSTAAAEAMRPTPLPTVSGARGTHTVALLRGDDAVVIPERSGRAEPVAFADLPDGMGARLPGAPVAAFSLTDGAGLTWRRLETTPAPEPPVLIDHALYEASFAASGSGAMRATWQVRNDRAPFLRIRLPEGWSAVSARVAGRPVALSREGNTLLVPLEKSTETMVGRVQLPVELSAIGPGDAWVRRGWHELQGPTVDAPVSHVEWQVTLPPERQVKKTEGARTPSPTSARIDMGSAMRDADSPDFDGDFGGGDFGGDGPMGVSMDSGRPRKAGKKKKAKEQAPTQTASSASQVLEETARKRTSTAYWSAAYDAYKDNDFDRAETLLSKSQELDPSNFAAQQLQSNIAVLNAPPADLDEADEAVARRVKAMARAKSGKTEANRERLKQEAKEAERAGDMDKAVQAYRQLVETTEQLASLEEEEAVEEKRMLETVRAELDRVEQQAQQTDGRTALLQLDVLAEPLDDDAPAGGGVLTRDFLERVPEGRSYQANVQLGTPDDSTVLADGVPGGVEGGVVGGVLGGAVGGLGARGQGIGGGGVAEGVTGGGSFGDDFFVEDEEEEQKVVVSQDRIVVAKPNAAAPPPPPPARPAPVVQSRTELDFEGIEVSGELVKPQGALLLDRKKVPAKHDELANEAAEFIPQAAEPPPMPVEAPTPEPEPMVDVQTASAEVRMARVRRRPVRHAMGAVVDALTPDPKPAHPPRPPLPEAAPGMTPLPTGISAARGDVALPVDPARLLHVEQQLLPADTAATFRVHLRPDRP